MTASSLSILLAVLVTICSAGVIYSLSKKMRLLQYRLRVVRMLLQESTRLLTPQQYALYEDLELECLSTVGASSKQDGL